MEESPKSNKHLVSASLHYATVFALFISLMTSFALAALLSYGMIGGGLGYFAYLREGVILRPQSVQAATGGPCAAPSGGLNALQAAAAGLAPGEWCELNLSGPSIQEIFFCCAGSANWYCLTYGEDMVWNPITNRLHFLGSPHIGENGHFIYDAATNTWSKGTHPAPSTCSDETYEHAYDHNALDPATGDIYYHMFGQNTTFRWNGSSWSQMADYPNTFAATWGMEWFPDRNELVISDGRGRLAKWTQSGGWAQIGTINPEVTYHQAIEYNPVHNVMWVYGGNYDTSHYKYDANGTITSLGTSPYGLGMTSAKVSVDPISGKFIVYFEDGTWRTYDISTNTWGSISHSMPPLYVGDLPTDDIEESIEEYGIITWVDYQDDAMYVYKHAAASTPSDPTACNTSGSGTALRNASNNLSAGSWCKLSTNYGSGYNALYSRTAPGPSQVLYAQSSSGVHHNLTYADSMTWNPIAKKVNYSAWSHGGGGQKHAVYDEATNTWGTATPDPGTYGHGYDQMTVNPATGRVYRLGYENTRTIWEWNGSAWSVFGETFPAYNYVGGIAWFPDRGSSGAMIAYVRDGQIHEYVPGSGWTAYSIPTGGQGYHMACEYSPVHRVVMCTEGGGTGFYIIGATGAPSARRTAPIGLGTTSVELSVDPASGNFIIHGSGTTWREYNPISNAWSTISHSMPPLTGQLPIEDYVQTPISTHGVIMYVSAYDNATYIYKHSVSSAVCGNGVVESGEQCDGSNLNGSSCTAQGFTGGTLSCSSCSFVTSQCTSQTGPVCGNGVVESGEQCDGSNLNSASCTTQGFTGGTLSCSSCSLVTTQCTGTPAQAAGNILNWPFTSSTVTDASGSGNDGTLSGATWISSGKNGGGFSFDGVNDYIYRPHAQLNGNFPAEVTNQDFTLSAWIHPTQQNRRNPIITKQGNSTRGFSFMVESNNQLYIEVFRDQSAKTELYSGTAIPLNAWTHVAVAYDYVGSSTSVIRLYINGNQVAQTTSAVGPVVTNTQSLDIGRYYWSGASNWHFSGMMDDARVYDSALTAQEVTTVFTGSGGTPVVDTTAPAISAGSPSGTIPYGAIQTTLSVATNESATCRYGTATGQAYAQKPNVFTTTGGTAHSATVTGLQNGQSYTYYVRCSDSANNANASDYTIAFSVSSQQSSVSYVVPNLQAERDTYTRWGWAWTQSDEPNFSTYPNFYVDDVDIHYDSEGDDLWSYLWMYRRTGQQGYLDRALAWADYFKNRMRSSQAYAFDRDGFQFDHMYGWGLIDLYQYNGDAAALATAEALGGDIETMYNKPQYSSGYDLAYYGARGSARHLLLATRLAEVTGSQRWINLRDKLITLWIASPWDPRGMYFQGDWSTDSYIGAGSYAAGYRMQSSYHIGILSEAFAHAYRTTGNTVLRDRMIAMARFVDQNGISPINGYTGSRFGVDPSGQPWHDYTTTFCDPVYTTSLVNTLVRGYQLTGDISLYNRAKHFFNRGTKGQYGSCTQRNAPDNEVHHFVDSKLASATGFFYLDFNKGELQYTYLIFQDPGSGNTPSDTTAPTVSLTAPANSATVSGSVTVSANASDNTGVSGVQFKLDGQNLGADDTSSPYSISWNTAQAANGAHSLTAVARDAAGNQTTSSAVSVTINNVIADTTPPTVSLSSPTNNATVSGTVTVTANASDTSGISGVQFKIDGQNLGPVDTSAPYAVSWNTTATANGSHSLTATATDTANNSSTSGAVTVTVSNDATPPTMSGITAGSITSSAATISWTTNEQATAQVQYGTTASYGSTVNRTTMATTHSLTLSGLTASTLYHYRVISTDGNGNAATSQDFMFTTTAVPDTTAPAAVSSLAISNITANAFTLNWLAPGDDGSTGTATSYDIRYATTPITLSNFAQATAVTGEPAPQSAGTQQTIAIGSLSSGTTYYVALRTTDDAGNVSGLSNVPSATTSATQSTDTTAPTVTNVQEANTNAHGVTITWTTNEPADATITYGTSQTALTQTQTSQALETTHSMTLTGLQRRTTYYYRITSRDAAGNQTQSTIQSFTTLPGRPPAPFNLQAANGSVILSWSAPQDPYLNRIEIYRRTDATVIDPVTHTSDRIASITTLSQTSFTDSLITAGITYYYTLYAVDDQNIYSDPATLSYVPQEPSSGSTGQTGGTTGGTTGGGGGGGGGGGSAPVATLIPDSQAPTIPTPPENQLPQTSSSSCSQSAGNTNLTATDIAETLTRERTRFKSLVTTLRNRLVGYILLQVEEHGESWYVDGVSGLRYYLANGQTAYEALRKFGLGITNADLAKIPVGLESRFQDCDTDGDGLPDRLEEGIFTDLNNPDSDGDGFKDGEEVLNGFSPVGPGRPAIDAAVANRLKGRILLQVEEKGQAWYVSPADGKRYYMKNGDAAYQIMRFLSLGISNTDLDGIPVGEGL